MGKPYRRCVVAVISDGKEMVLAGERSDQAGAWQLPQGGIDEGESPEEAVYREILEEIGTDKVVEIQRLSELIRYEFPAHVTREELKVYRGQEQTWFLFQFQEGADHDLSRADGEFSAIRWMRPKDLLDSIVSWKKEAYRVGLHTLGLL